jgi:hypothetical protein
MPVSLVSFPNVAARFDVAAACNQTAEKFNLSTCAERTKRRDHRRPTIG